jgi:hypothetical protein
MVFRFTFVLSFSRHVLTSPSFALSVVRGARHGLDAMADSKDPSIRLAGFEYVKVDPYIPILDLSLAKRNRSSSARLSNAIIQGLFDVNSRDYIGIFNDLVVSLQSGCFSSIPSCPLC